MALTASCDICHKNLTSPDEFARLKPQLSVPGVIEDVCENCVKRIDIQYKRVKDNYERDISNDMREWLLNESKKTRKGHILTK